MKVNYKLLSDKALPPVDNKEEDSGYDLNVVQLEFLYKTPFGAEVYKGYTNVAVEPEPGFVFDLNGRSGLPAKGWMFLQGTGIIDYGYRGDLSGHFMKLSSEPLPSLPWRALQLVPREKPPKVTWNGKEALGVSERGEKGFGSSGE